MPQNCLQTQVQETTMSTQNISRTEDLMFWQIQDQTTDTDFLRRTSNSALWDLKLERRQIKAMILYLNSKNLRGVIDRNEVKNLKSKLELQLLAVDNWMNLKQDHQGKICYGSNLSDRGGYFMSAPNQNHYNNNNLNNTDTDCDDFNSYQKFQKYLAMRRKYRKQLTMSS